MNLRTRVIGWISIAALLGGAVHAKAAETTPPIVHAHFIGIAALASNTNATKLKEIWTLPESVALRSNLLQKIAASPAQLFPNAAISKQKPDELRQLLLPLIEDVIRHETVIELTDDRGLNLAVQLSANRASLWSSNMATITSCKDGKKSHWSNELLPGRVISFARTDKWTFVTIGDSSQMEEFSARVGKKKASLQKDNWLEAKVDWVRLEKAFGISIPFKCTESEITLTGKADNLFTRVRSTFPEAFNWKAEPWHVPTVIRDPVITFTASQPVAAFCKEGKLFQQIGFNPLTRQFFFWSQPELPFQTFGALLSQDATNELKAFGPKLCAAVNPMLEDRRSGKLTWQTNEVLWTNVPMMAPYIRPYKDEAGEYIVGGLFPRAPQKKSPPKELLDHINGRPELVYYDWEITQNRIGHWDMVSRTLPVFSPETFTNSGPLRLTRNSHTPGHVWVRAVARFLGNTATEVTVSGPRELLLKRRSDIGFTGAELLYLVGLMDEKQLPFLNYSQAKTGAASK